MASAVDTDNDTLNRTQRPDFPDNTRAGLDTSRSLQRDGEEGEEGDELDTRANEVEIVPQYVDMPDADLRSIVAITLAAYNTYVLVPARNTWRKEEGSRRELEREVERTAISDITKEVKKAVDAKLGGCWHVVFGRDFGTYVSHQTQCFCHFQLDGANVVVWRHGM